MHRFDQVLVSTALQSIHLVVERIPRGHEDDIAKDPRSLDAAAQLEPPHVRHHPVGKEDVRRICLILLPRFDAVRRKPKPRHPAQLLGQDHPRIRIVLRHKDV